MEKWADEISARASRGLGFCGIENNFWKERGRNAEGEGEGAKRIRITAPQILASNSGEGGQTEEGRGQKS